MKNHFQSFRSWILGPTFIVPGPTYELNLGSQISAQTFRVPGLRSRVPRMKWVPDLGSRVPPTVPSLGSHFSDMPKILFIHFTLKTCLSGSTNIVRYNNKEKYVYSGYEIAFDGNDISGVLVMTLLEML